MAEFAEKMGEKDGQRCSTHRKPMKDYGTKWLCEGPPQHTEAK